MINTSTENGWLTPTDSNDVHDQVLERKISDWITGLTGMTGDVIFPRWQSDPVRSRPAMDVTWCAFGVTEVDDGANSIFIQQDDDAQLWRHQTLDVLFSFYGPQGQNRAVSFRDGLSVPQNNDMLKSTGLTFNSCGRLLSVPDLINNQWQRRYDLPVRLRRKLTRQYGVKSILEPDVILNGD